MKKFIIMSMIILTGCATLTGNKSINQQVDKIVAQAHEVVCKGTAEEKAYAASKIANLINQPVNVDTMCGK